MPTSAQYVTFVLLLLPPVITMYMHSYFYYAGLKSKVNPCPDTKEKRGNSGSLTIIIPVRNEPPEIILGSIKSLDALRDELRNFELLIVCDDPPEVAEKLRDIVLREAEKLGLPLNFIVRDNPKHGRVGALNYAVRNSSSDYVLILDVDSRPQPGYLTKLINCVTSCADACVGRWSAYWIKATKLASTLKGSMDFIVDSLYKGRRALGSLIFPLGSGTIYRRKSLEAVGLWDNEIIQDDMHIGAKLFSKGFKVEFIDSAEIKVLVPSKYYALRIQQLRWAFGSAETIRKSFRHLMKAPYSFLQKLEALCFLGQYFSQSLVALSAFIVPFSSLLLDQDLMMLSPELSVLLLSGFTVYGLTYYHSLRRRGMGRLRAIRTMGASGALTLALSPLVMVYTFFGLLGKRIPFRVTPKGSEEEKRRTNFLPEFCFLAYVIAMIILNSLFNHVFTALWLALFAASIAYVVIRIEKPLTSVSV